MEIHDTVCHDSTLMILLFIFTFLKTLYVIYEYDFSRRFFGRSTIHIYHNYIGHEFSFGEDFN